MRSILILFIALTLMGCKTTVLNPRYPIIPTPERPKISANLTKEDFKKVVKYATQLEIGIKEYNDYAKEENKKVDEHFKNR